MTDGSGESPDIQGTDDEMMLGLQRETFDFFLKSADARTGLILDATRPGAPASIAVIGLGLAAYVVGVDRGLLSRNEALKRTLQVLRFFMNSEQSDAVDATGHQGLYYHFLDPQTGKRAWQSELSTIDTALLLVGMLVAAEYFDRQREGEKEVRGLVQKLVARANWQWALNGEKTISHGWKPESGFLPGRWDCGYNEAHILYVLALGSTDFPVEPEGYTEWTKTFEVKEFYGQKYIYAGPLFIHQMSQLWLDFRNLRDDYTRGLGHDYFENSRRATYAQRSYAIDNPKGFAHYNENGWGITASDGPGPALINVNGVDRFFYDYIARGAPDDIDDGTLSPWAVVTSLPFAPEIVHSTVRHAIERLHLKRKRQVKGFDASYNPTFPDHERNRLGWVSRWRFGLNQGPIIIMIENYKTGLIWNLMKKNIVIQKGLQRAGFR